MISAKQFLAVSALGLLLASAPAKATPAQQAGTPAVDFTPSETMFAPDEETLTLGFQTFSGANAKVTGLGGTLTFSSGNGQTTSFTVSTLTGSFSHTFSLPATTRQPTILKEPLWKFPTAASYCRPWT